MNFDFIDDKECIPLVQFFNDNGLKTRWCCSGKDGHGYGFYYIIFDDSVTDEELNKMLDKHSYKTRYNGQAFCGATRGWFCRRQWHNLPDRMLAYVALSAERANEDLELWITNRKLNEKENNNV
jgi:hypothetical protein